MKPRLIDLESTTNAIRPYLEQYLQEHGINTSKNFTCLNPKHTDSTASMTCKDVPERAFCFGCSCAVDIFAAAHYLEDKPMKGADFVNENILYLAKKYGIQVQLADLTQEEMYEYRTYQAYRLAAEMISDSSFGNYKLINKEIKRRGWDKEKLAEWGIGTVDFKEFRDRLKKAGYEPKFLGGVDLDRSNLFDNHNLLFTVYDDQGRPVGFSAKNLKYNPDNKTTGPKYINTRGTGLECAIFKKGERLYGYEIAKDAPEPLYLFEGQADVITARHQGMMNCCCTMGTAFTDHHITLLKKHGSFNIVLVFDSDVAGELAIQKALDEKFAKEKDFRVKLCQLPAGQDPDDLIRDEGFEAFVRLKKWTAFEWRMMKFMEDSEDEFDEEKKRDIAEKMVPIIVSEKSHIRQEEMSKQVSKMTGYDLSTIISEVKRQRSEKDAEVQTKKKNLIEALLTDVKRNPQDAEIALTQCQSAISDINKSLQVENEESSTMSAIMSLKEIDEKKTGEFAGFFLKPDGLGNIAARLDDDWKTDNLFYIGGSEQAGKTTFAAQMAYEIADDPRNNAICIYHSIDDAKKMIIYKWLCNATNDRRLTLNMAGNPNYWRTKEGCDFVPQARENGYKHILKMVKNGQLVVKDASDGASVSYAEGVTRYYRELYPEKKIVLFIDNFHKLPDYAEINGHERIKRLSNHLKNMAVALGITIVSTVEYRKLQAGEKPSNMAIAECLVEDTIVVNATTGERTKIKDIKPGTIVNTINNNTFKITPNKVLNKVFKGIQDCYKVTLNTGAFIKGTENHPLLRDDGQWVKISDLKPGDYVACPAKQKILEQNKIDVYNKDIARFLGYMAGDGNYGTNSSKTNSSTPRFCNKDKEICDDIKNIVLNNFKNIKITEYVHNDGLHMNFSRTSNKIQNSVTEFMKKEKIWSQLGSDKSIPKTIFTSSSEIKLNYLAGLMASDGTISKSDSKPKNNHNERFFNNSYKLIRQAQDLFLEFGIVTTITTKHPKNKKHKTQYTLRICNCSIPIAKVSLPIVGKKIKRLKRKELSKQSTNSIDNLPIYFSKEMHKFLKKSKEHTVWVPSWRETEKYKYQFMPHKSITRNVYRKIKEHLPNIPYLKKFTSNEVIWVKIQSIKSIGKHPTYDLEIDGTHNFIADNIFCHNSRSLAYDSNVIFHLHNDMHHNGENEAVLVHYDDDGKPLPRIWCKFGKNKVSGYEGREFLDLYGAHARMVGVPLEQAIQDQKDRIELLKDTNTNKLY